ncbi:MAG TPA: hypothetical protein VF765_17835 [Polyangiaceae bacterium]
MPNRASLQAPLFAAVTSAIVALASTATAQQYEARTVAPPTVEHTRQGELMLGLTGGLLLGLPYAASVWAAAESERPTDRLLYLPVVGPFGAIINRAVCSAPGCRGSSMGDTLPLVADGIAQTAGFALIMIAINTRTRAESAPATRTRATLHVVPASYRGGGGLAAFGTF